MLFSTSAYPPSRVLFRKRPGAVSGPGQRLLRLRLHGVPALLQQPAAGARGRRAVPVPVLHVQRQLSARQKSARSGLGFIELIAGFHPPHIPSYAFESKVRVRVGGGSNHCHASN